MLHEVQIRVADTRVGKLDEDLARLGLRDLMVTNLDGILAGLYTTSQRSILVLAPCQTY